MENEPIWKVTNLTEEVAKLREMYYKTHPRARMPRAIVAAATWIVYCPFCKQTLRPENDRTIWMTEDRKENTVRCCPRCGKASLIPALPQVASGS